MSSRLCPPFTAMNCYENVTVVLISSIIPELVLVLTHFAGEDIHANNYQSVLPLLQRLKYLSHSRLQLYDVLKRKF